MKDLTAIFNTGLVIALFAIGGWLCIVLLVFLLRQFARLLKGMARVNDSLTHINPYIMAHKKMLLQKEQYQEYAAVAAKDGIFAEEGYDNAGASAKAKKEKKKKNK